MRGDSTDAAGGSATQGIMRRMSQAEDPRAAVIRGMVRDVPDFPKPGILFKDITPLLADPRTFTMILDSFAETFVGRHIDAIVGIESRGFIFGGALAARLNCSFVPVRKPGKLPYPTTSIA
jgi:adenine phosphoribosyltransferase